MGSGLPDLKNKKKGKQKAPKDAHVSEALDKLREQTREAVKGLEFMAPSSADDFGKDAMMEDWVKHFEDLAGSQPWLPVPLMGDSYWCTQQMQKETLMERTTLRGGQRSFKWLCHISMTVAESRRKFTEGSLWCPDRNLEDINSAIGISGAKFMHGLNLGDHYGNLVH
ncbi:Peroxisome biogenesis protein [Arachis hypogaea]|nr:Peroxisome biogenesis protein [Arachis hypogaea]